MIDWNLLGIEPTDDISAIKRAYALKSKEYHPEEQPEKFRQLHSSYKEAVSLARKRGKTSSVPPQSKVPTKSKSNIPTESDFEIPVDSANQNSAKTAPDFESSPDDIFDKIDAEVKKQNSEYIVGINRLLKMIDIAFSQKNILKISYAVNEIKDSEDFKKYKDDRRFLKALCDYLNSKNYTLKTLAFLYNLYDIDGESNGGSGKYDELAEIINEQAQIESSGKIKRRNKIIKAAAITVSAAVIILRLLISNDVFSGI